MSRYVIFKENPNTHHEQYVAHVDDRQSTVTTTFNVDEALRFASASEAYRYGAWNRPLLDWWRVGVR